MTNIPTDIFARNGPQVCRSKKFRDVMMDETLLEIRIMELVPFGEYLHSKDQSQRITRHRAGNGGRRRGPFPTSATLLLSEHDCRSALGKSADNLTRTPETCGAHHPTRRLWSGMFRGRRSMRESQPARAQQEDCQVQD